jgi:hypothetical protein
MDDEIMSTDSSVKENSIAKCQNCSGIDYIFIFPCNENFCAECLINYCFSVLYNFSKMVRLNPSFYNGAASSLGCPNLCEMSDLCLRPLLLLNYIDICKTLKDQDKELFYELINHYKGFFGGIKTYFSLCVNCVNVIADHIQCKDICDKCLSDTSCENLVSITIIRQLKKKYDFIVYWKNSQENIQEFKKRSSKAEYFLVELRGNELMKNDLKNCIAFRKYTCKEYTIALSGHDNKDYSEYLSMVEAVKIHEDDNFIYIRNNGCIVTHCYIQII